MQFSLATIAVVAGLLPTIHAHLWMEKPKMFAQHGQNEGFVLNPLEPDGSNFPCQNGIPDGTVPAGNELELGGNGVLQIKGSAVHGGGSGQMVISYDFPPSKDTNKWRVLSSYEGNHPLDTAGNLPDGQDGAIPALSYKVWDFLPPGKAIVAWNWYNHIGNREHYMKCAVVSIGGSSKEVRGAMETTALKRLPTMFRANSEGKKCISETKDNPIKFKNPGNSVFGTGLNIVPCDASVAGTDGNRGGAPSTSPKPPTTKPPTTKPPTTKPPTTKPPTKPTPGEDESTGDDEDIPAPVPIIEEPVPETPIDKPIVSPPSTPSPPASGACTEGAVVCNSDGTWSQCGSGILWNMGGTGAGRICRDGALVLDPSWAGAKLPTRRAIRFSKEHMRRRHTSF